MSLQLLTPVQVARCIVQGWPYTPDTLAICSWVAAEDGDAGALAVLTAPTRSAPTAGANWAATSQNGFAAGDLGSRGRRGICTVFLVICLTLLTPSDLVLQRLMRLILNAECIAWKLRKGLRQSHYCSIILCSAGSGPLTANASGQSGEGHLTSLAQLPMSVPSNDTAFDLGPSASTQHHSGSQAWSLNEPV